MTITIQPCHIFLRWAFVLILVLLMPSGCSKIKSSNNDEYLIRLGDRIVTISDYNKSLSLAKTAYPVDIAEDKAAFKSVQLRTLNQLIEELILQKQAEAYDIFITDDELKAAVNNIKKDYPEEEFDQVLLENVISYKTWEERLKSRLLMEKVVNQVIAPGIRVSPEEITEYVKELSKQDEYNDDGSSPEKNGTQPAGSKQPTDPGISESEGQGPKPLDFQETDMPDNERIILNLRRMKVEAAYNNWINEHKGSYNVEINNEKWIEIVGD